MDTPYKNLSLAELAELAFQYATGELPLSQAEADELVQKLEERLVIVDEFERTRTDQTHDAA